MKVASKDLSNNYVELKIEDKNRAPRYFKVQKNASDEFCRKYEAKEKKYNTIQWGILAGSILTGTFAVNLFSKKISNNILRFMVNTTAGICSAIGAMQIFSDIYYKKDKEFLNRNNVKEIFYMNDSKK